MDSNILSALWSAEPIAVKIEESLAELRAAGGLVIGGPVFVELAGHPLATPTFIRSFLHETEITVDFDLEEPIWRQAAVAFASYAARRRKSGGDSPKRLLADFLVASHAIIKAERLMTLDPKRYRQDFPKLRLINPA